jgi:hypothetical protein
VLVVLNARAFLEPHSLQGSKPLVMKDALFALPYEPSGLLHQVPCCGARPGLAVEGVPHLHRSNEMSKVLLVPKRNSKKVPSLEAQNISCFLP